VHGLLGRYDGIRVLVTQRRKDIRLIFYISRLHWIIELGSGELIGTNGSQLQLLPFKHAFSHYGFVVKRYGSTYSHLRQKSISAERQAK
jgi:hypothetical protein